MAVSGPNNDPYNSISQYGVGSNNGNTPVKENDSLATEADTGSSKEAAANTAAGLRADLEATMGTVSADMLAKTAGASAVSTAPSPAPVRNEPSTTESLNAAFSAEDIAASLIDTSKFDTISSAKLFISAKATETKPMSEEQLIGDTVESLNEMPEQLATLVEVGNLMNQQAA